MLIYSDRSFSGWIGAAREDITPPAGIYARNWGAAAHEVAEGVHRPLTLTALTLQSAPETPPLVLICADLGWWRRRSDEWSVRGGLIEALALDPARVMLHFTHTHSGPSVCLEDEEKPGGRLIRPYLERLREAAIRAARSALGGRRPAVVSWAYGRCGLARNRDLPDPERPRIACGFNPAGPADDTLLVGRVTGEDGAILATLVNYACHPVTLAWESRLLSPDFVGAMREVVEARTAQASMRVPGAPPRDLRASERGSQAQERDSPSRERCSQPPCLFLQGASGELAPREQYTGDPAVADRHGRHLGHATLAVLEGMLPPSTELHYNGVVESGAPLATWRYAPARPSVALDAAQADIDLPLKAMPSLAEIDEELRACGDRVLAERLARKRRIRVDVGDGPTTPMPLWAWRAGDALFVGHPNEAYSRLQTDLRARFAGRPVVVMNVTNGHYGYLPPPDLYDHDIYPVWQTPFDRGSLERLIQASEDLCERLLSAPPAGR